MEDYDYEVYASHSKSKDYQAEYRAKLEAASDYYVPYDADTGSNMINWDLWWQPLSEDGFNEIFGLNDSASESSVTTLGASLSGTLYELPAGPLGFSALVEYEKSEYDINVNARTLGNVGQGWSGLTGTEGSGDRARTAIALEFAIPLTEQIDMHLAGRYDNYNDETEVGGAATWQLGLTYRPTDELLLRANYGTTFRAPDLHNVFKDPSGSYTTITDYALFDSCTALAAGNTGGILIGGNDTTSLNAACTQDYTESYQTFGVSQGSRTLKEETGSSLTVGFVWEPMDGLNLSVDYYNIKMADAVRPFPLSRIMRTERDCYAGTEDINSNLCQNAIAAIDRNGGTGFNTSYKVNETRSSFINAAVREQTGFDINVNYSYEIDGYGEISFKTEYSHVLKTTNQWFTGDEIDDEYRDDYFNGEFRSKMTTTLGFATDDWRITLQQHRYGSLPNDVSSNDWTQVDEKRYAPWFNYNLGVNYIVNESASVRLGINNLLDSRARGDASEGGNTGQFNIFSYPALTIIKGREFTLNYTQTF
jgi:outer membrane receptor protein involved in Fe transport